MVTAARNLSVFTAFAVHRFTAAGEFLQRWGTDGFAPGQFDSPAGVAVDRAGNVYVADTNNNRVQKFSSTGRFIRQWGSMGDGLLRGPTDVAVDPQGTVYVVDSRNRKIQKFSSTGAFLGKWGSPKASLRGESSFVHPSEIAVDREGRVYVVGDFGDEIQIFARDGTFITQWEGDSWRGALATVRGPLPPTTRTMSTCSEATGWGSLAPTSRSSIHGRTRAIRLPVTWPLTAGAPSMWLRVTTDGKWEPRPRALSRRQGTGGVAFLISQGTASFKGNNRITVDSAGRVFLVEGSHCRVEVFDAGGAFLGRWGACGFGDGQFDGATGIAVDAAGKVYVADYNNNRVQVFQVRDVPARR